MHLNECVPYTSEGYLGIVLKKLANMEVRKMINTWYMQCFCVCCFFHERLDHFSKSIYEFSCKDNDCRQTDTHAFRKLSYINYANENFFFGFISYFNSDEN